MGISKPKVKHFLLDSKVFICLFAYVVKINKALRRFSYTSMVQGWKWSNLDIPNIGESEAR